MRSTPDVVVVGSANLDTTLRVPRVPVAGETLLATGSSSTPGGKGANQAVAAAVAGARVRFVGAVGQDRAGEVIKSILQQHGVDLSSLQLLGTAPTGTATVVVDDDGENLIVVDPGANAGLAPQHVHAALDGLEVPVLLCQLEVPLDTVRAAATHQAARCVVLNPAPMGSAEALAEVLPLVDVLVPNQSELAQLTGGGPAPITLEEVGDRVSRLTYAGAVVVTLGAQGAAVFPAAGAPPTHVPAPTVDAIDTSGAGDVFCGVLAHGLSQGEELEEATRRAVVLAARSTTFRGAQMPLAGRS
ncbi:ribokinase [Ornithinimicrobium humiphilum]|uniref:Ribokinase n=1 Tax=Ornithinimicrobium humiphilum TaxID=125288 RepID=A0A543KRG1_9MICO|nr:ribokinase [Ornithinimicrobium humiphilum]TQM97651.1 ribokinase [Ornithinimicrobium humiphilum]